METVAAGTTPPVHDRPWHSLRVAEIFSSFDTPPGGLSGTEASERLRRFGYNRISEPEKMSPLKILLNQLKGFFNIILFIAALIALGVGYLPGRAANLHEVIFIVVIIILNTIISFIEEYKASQSIQSLHRVMKRMARVMRNGQEIVTDANEIVPGDLVILSEGDRIPADGRIIESFGLMVDESVLTGESVSIDKDNLEVPEEAILAERTNMAYSGTYVTRGSSKVLITGTGMATEIGKIAADLYEIRERPTSFQIEIARLGRQVTLAIAVIVAVIASTSYIVEHLSFYDVLINSISLGVAAVPESLPVVMTFALALGTRRMLGKKALVKHLSVVEDLGSVDVICTDKTGTLTENRVSVEKVYADGRISLPEEDVAGAAMPHLLRAAILCNEARTGSIEGGDKAWIGDPTEIGLLMFAGKRMTDPEAERSRYPRIGEIPFSSETRKMTSIHTVDGRPVAYSKGALRVILNDCDRIFNNGDIVHMNPEDRDRITTMGDSMAGEALRVLAFACRELPSQEMPEGEIEKGMIFLGFVGMMDPPRKEISGAVRIAQEAGIRVIMITGDHKKTAQAIAGRIGLGNNAAEGKDIDRLPIVELAGYMEGVDIVARATPRTKDNITRALQERGHFVAMTGVTLHIILPDNFTLN